MVSLVDIGDLKDTIELRGKEVEIRGVTASDIVGIFYRFPEIRMVLTQVQPEANIVQTLIARAPDAVACVIAAACGVADDEKSIAVASSLTVGEQYAALEKIVKLTFPQGAQNFLDGVQGLLGKVQVNGGLGWAPATTSPAPSKDASQQEGQSETAGTAPPVS